MRKFRIILVTGLLSGMLALGATSVEAQLLLRDIGPNWAKEHIEALVERGIVSGYPDRTFRPEQPVTRAEFAKMVASAFPLEKVKDVSFNDIGRHWARAHILKLAEAGIVQGYPGGEFRPDEKITRAEVVSMIVRVLKLHDVSGFQAQPSFSDVGTTHWAYDAIEAARRLGLLPPYLDGTFEPSKSANRAETAALISGALKLQITRGTLDYVDPAARVVGVRTDQGLRDFTLDTQTVLHRNTSLADFDRFVVGDAIYVVSDRFGTPRFVKANGTITGQDVASKVASVTRGLLTPSDLRAIIRGDWDELAGSLKSKIYDELLARGATPLEAEAITSRDWSSLQGLARDRLAQVIADYLGVTSDLAKALLNRDWETARELAQVEAVEQLLGQFLLDQPAAG